MRLEDQLMAVEAVHLVHLLLGRLIAVNVPGIMILWQCLIPTLFPKSLPRPHT